MSDLNSLIKDPKTWLIDVRTPAEVQEKSVDGADNIPLHKVPEHLEKIKNASGAVVLFCRSGNRSEQARQWLAHQGVENVHNGGGIGDVLIHTGQF